MMIAVNDGGEEASFSYAGGDRLFQLFHLRGETV